MYKNYTIQYNTKVQHPSGIVYRNLDFEAMISLTNQTEKQGTEFVMSHKKHTKNLGKQKKKHTPYSFYIHHMFL
jgi:hypothetical protein